MKNQPDNIHDFEICEVAECAIKVPKMQNLINNELKDISNGYGSCKSCSCRGWIPNYPKNDYCKNCGHHWVQHS